jgi:hypothetical protein
MPRSPGGSIRRPSLATSSTEENRWRPFASGVDSKAVETAGIAPASQFSHVETQQGRYVDARTACLHAACTDFVLRELVANWHRLTQNVSAAILQLVRSRGEPLVSDLSPAAATSATLINAGCDNYSWCPRISDDGPR